MTSTRLPRIVIGVGVAWLLLIVLIVWSAATGNGPLDWLFWWLLAP